MTFHSRSVTSGRLAATLALVASLALSACVSTPGPQVKGPGLCKADGLEWAVGQPADEATMRKLSAQSGAGLVNPIGPETITTVTFARIACACSSTSRT